MNLLWGLEMDQTKAHWMETRMDQRMTSIKDQMTESMKDALRVRRLESQMDQWMESMNDQMTGSMKDALRV